MLSNLASLLKGYFGAVWCSAVTLLHPFYSNLFFLLNIKTPLATTTHTQKKRERLILKKASFPNKILAVLNFYTLFRYFIK